MSRKPPPPPDDDEAICPVCKSSRYLNPQMRFLVNPECYHKMCESCVDRIFSHGPAPCPVAGCRKTLRKQRFRKQTFADITIEREVDIRRRVAGIFNKREMDFETLRDYNNYLEEVESLTFNLIERIDVDATERKLEKYQAENAESIIRNAMLEGREGDAVLARRAAEKEAARQGREAALLEELEEKKAVGEARQEVLKRLKDGSAGEDPDRIVEEARINARKKAGDRRREMENRLKQSQAALTVGRGRDQVGGGKGKGYQIQGLKQVLPPSISPPYSPFAGLHLETVYYDLQDSYDYPWVEDAKKNVMMCAGGYDVGEYCTRAMFEAFAGFGVLVEDEVKAREETTKVDITAQGS
ncbi:TFIIH/NER complex subunit [Agyrium rufum]|nr:TFIIH/NER complex subunit [Agyrium rufum]